MRFSVFLNARSMSPEQDRSVMQSLVSHATLADTLGFDAIFLPDHHFTGYMPFASDSFMFAAYLAATLKRVHFGFSVVSVPLHNPVRFVERINILDQLTNGRILVGVGSGTTPEELIGFGVSYKDASKVTEENLAIAEKLWRKRPQDPPVSFDNQGHYRGELLQRIAPAPYTTGHARLMPVALKDSSARRAAENGWPAFIPAFTPPKIGGLEPATHVKKYFDAYRGHLQSFGHAPVVISDALSWTTHTYQCVHVASTDAKARQEVEVILRGYQAAIEREAKFGDKAEQTEGNKKSESVPDALSEEWMATWCLYGSPATVVNKLKVYEEIGIGNVLCGTLTGPLTAERLRFADQTLELLSSEVMPHFRTDGSRSVA
jgi:alkanesulfonate monooxygenase SsuD/methylene tetrahydromethanopterin reductase-like flavin-dependent oxidoreductase (luciferase family)